MWVFKAGELSGTYLSKCISTAQHQLEALLSERMGDGTKLDWDSEEEGFKFTQEASEPPAVDPHVQAHKTGPEQKIRKKKKHAKKDPQVHAMDDLPALASTSADPDPTAGLAVEKPANCDQILSKSDDVASTSSTSFAPPEPPIVGPEAADLSRVETVPSETGASAVFGPANKPTVSKKASKTTAGKKSRKRTEPSSNELQSPEKTVQGLPVETTGTNVATKKDDGLDDLMEQLTSLVDYQPDTSDLGETSQNGEVAVRDAQSVKNDKPVSKKSKLDEELDRLFSELAEEAHSSQEPGSSQPPGAACTIDDEYAKFLEQVAPDLASSRPSDLPAPTPQPAVISAPPEVVRPVPIDPESESASTVEAQQGEPGEPSTAEQPPETSAAPKKEGKKKKSHNQSIKSNLALKRKGINTLVAKWQQVSEDPTKKRRQ